MSYISYDKWLDTLSNTIEKLDKNSFTEIGDQKNRIHSELFLSLNTLGETEIKYNLRDLNLKIFSCRLAQINNKDAYKISSYLENIETLVLYLDSNVTACSRYEALMYKLN